MSSPIPTDRIVMVDVRNLDVEEAALIDATDVTIAKFERNGETNEISSAVQQLREQRFICRRCAANRGSDECVRQLQPIIAVLRSRLTGESGFVQRGVQKVS